MKKILHVLSGNKTFSGVASYLYQQYKYINQEKVHYDFFFCKENSMELVMNDPVFTISKFTVANARTQKLKSTNYFKFMRELNKVLSETHYDAIVVNTSIVAIIFSCLIVLRKFPQTVLIPHAHNANIILEKKALRNKLFPLFHIVDNILRWIIRSRSFALFACSARAGARTFGEKCLKLDKFKIIHDAIDLDYFEPNMETAKTVREETKTQMDTFVLGNIGRLARIKNQGFLIEVFSYIHLTIPNSQLWLIGKGTTLIELKEMTKRYGIEECVLFFGEKSDAYRYYQAMDVFAFPSLSEGLGIVAIEAQAAGVPTIVSGGVPKEVLITEISEQLSLDEGADVWAKHIIALYKKHPAHLDYSSALIKAGYEIKSEAKRVEEYYCSI